MNDIRIEFIGRPTS